MKRKLIVGLLLLCLVVGGIVVYNGYRLLRKPNVSQQQVITIPTGSDFDDVLIIMKDVLDDAQGFKELSELKKYVNRVKPGRYGLEEGWSNEQVIDQLRSGEQVPVKLTFNDVHTLEALAAKLAEYIESDSLTILKELKDEQVVRKAGFQPETFMAAFIPNTYEIWWNTDPGDLVQRLIAERKRFWKGRRREKAQKLGLNTQEVATLASIVRGETTVLKDAPTIAGVYMNRLRIGMPLQADPTLLFVLGDPSVRRVLDKDKEIDSPYNTYKNTGLPPGPINIPVPQYIDAVLDHKKHGYLYFCASADLDGKTVFAKTYGEHLRNARAYQRALNQQGTYR